MLGTQDEKEKEDNQTASENLRLSVIRWEIEVKFKENLKGEES